MRYPEITKDEVMYWFDMLQNNSIRNISTVTGIHKDKVRKIIDNRF